MMKKAIASSRIRHEGGFTLIEVLVTIALLTTTLFIMVPAMSKLMETAQKKRNVAEAEMVCAAVGVYMAEKSISDPISFLDLYDNMQSFPLGSEYNVLSHRIEGYTKGSEIRSISYNIKSMSFDGIIYDVNGYRIQVFPNEGEPKVSKQFIIPDDGGDSVTDIIFHFR